MAKRDSKGRFLKRGKKRRSNPRKKRRVRAVATAATPRRRRRRSTARHVKRHTKARRRSNPRVTRRRRHRHSNPRFSISSIKDTVMTAGGGALGAIGLDVALSFIPLPDALKTGLPKQGIRAVGALGLGYLASKMLGPSVGKSVTMGALTVVLYDTLKSLITQYSPVTIPGLAGDYEDISLGYISPAPILQDNSMGAYMESGIPDTMGAYMDL